MIRVYHSCTRCCLVVVRLRLQDIKQILQISISYINLKYRGSLWQIKSSYHVVDSKNLLVVITVM